MPTAQKNSSTTGSKSGNVNSAKKAWPKAAPKPTKPGPHGTPAAKPPEPAANPSPNLPPSPNPNPPPSLSPHSVSSRMRGPTPVLSVAEGSLPPPPVLVGAVREPPTPLPCPRGCGDPPRPERSRRIPPPSCPRVYILPPRRRGPTAGRGWTGAPLPCPRECGDPPRPERSRRIPPPLPP